MSHFHYYHILLNYILLFLTTSNHPKHLLRSILHIFIRDVLMHRLLKCHRTRQNREYGINERWILLSGACAAMFDAAGKHDDFAAAGFGAAGDTDRGLAHRGLTIEAALSGDDDVGGAKFGFRQDSIKDDIDSRTECAVQVRCKSETKSTCCSRSRLITKICAECDGGHVCQMCQYRIKFLNGCRIGSFLRSEDVTCATGTAQRIGHITCY